MCRWAVYMGPAILLEDILFKPSHSVVKMSTEHFLPGLSSPDEEDKFRNLVEVAKMNHVINKDGFGVGWYPVPEKPSSSSSPAVPAPELHKIAGWSEEDKELPALAHSHRSQVIFAHNRAASSGRKDVHNTHPWVEGRFIWMHNGTIACFQDIRKALLTEMGPELADSIQGTSDSEHAFHLFLHFLVSSHPNSARDTKSESLDAFLLSFPSSPEALQAAILKTIQFIINEVDRFCDSVSRADRKHSNLNFVVGDGEAVVACRFRDSLHEQPASLYYAHGVLTELKSGALEFLEPDKSADFKGAAVSKEEALERQKEKPKQASSEEQQAPAKEVVDQLVKEAPEGGHQAPAKGRAVVVSSEPLVSSTDSLELQAEWTLVPANHMIVVDVRRDVKVVPIKLDPAKMVADRLVRHALHKKEAGN